MDAKIEGWKFDEEQDPYTVSKHFTTMYLLITKGKRVTLPGNPGWPPPWTSDQIASNGTNLGARGTPWHFGDMPAKMHYLNLTIKKHRLDPHWGTLYETTDVKLSKVSRSWKFEGLSQTGGDQGNHMWCESCVVLSGWITLPGRKDIVETMEALWVEML